MDKERPQPETVASRPDLPTAEQTMSDVLPVLDRLRPGGPHCAAATRSSTALVTPKEPMPHR